MENNVCLNRFTIRGKVVYMNSKEQMIFLMVLTAPAYKKGPRNCICVPKEKQEEFKKLGVKTGDYVHMECKMSSFCDRDKEAKTKSIKNTWQILTLENCQKLEITNEDKKTFRYEHEGIISGEVLSVSEFKNKNKEDTDRQNIGIQIRGTIDQKLYIIDCYMTIPKEKWNERKLEKRDIVLLKCNTESKQKKIKDEVRSYHDCNIFEFQRIGHID